MAATTPPDTIPVNRIAGHLPTAPAAPSPAPLPATPEERQQLWADTLAAALLALQTRLAHRDPAVVERAVFAILDLEKTRLRHGRGLAGTHVPNPALARLDALAGNLLESDHAEPDAPAANDWDKDWPDAGLDDTDRLHNECEAILDDARGGRGVLPDATPEEQEAVVERFLYSDEYRAVVAVFEEIVRDCRGKELPAQVGDRLAREFFFRRLRRGDTVGGMVVLKGIDFAERTDGYRVAFAKE